MKIKDLESNIEFIKKIIASHNEDVGTLNSSLKRLDSYNFGIKEVCGKFKDYVEKKRSDLAASTKEGKINPQVANLIFQHLNESSQFLKKESSEAEKIFNVRQGELLSLKNQAKKLENMLGDLEKEKAAMEASDLAANEIEVNFENEEQTASNFVSSSEKVRPDKDPKTPVGRAAMDLVARRRKTAIEVSEANSDNSKKIKTRKPRK